MSTTTDSFVPAVTLKDIYYSYNRNSLVLDAINLDISVGENVALLGPNGAGKTTLLRCMNHLIHPQRGRVNIMGDDLLNCSHKKQREILRQVAMIFQDLALIESISVMDNVLIGRLGHCSLFRGILGTYARLDRELAMHSLVEVGMQDFAGKEVRKLSGGQRQKVAIARAIVQEPRMILADEPVSSLDPRSLIDIMNLLRNKCFEKKITLIMVLHVVEVAKLYADRIIGMAKGKLIFDTPSLHLSETDLVRLYGYEKTLALREL